MKPETKNEIGRCQSKRRSNASETAEIEIRKTGAAARAHQPLRFWFFPGMQLPQNRSDGKDLAQPDEHRGGINPGVVKNAGLEKAVLERLSAEEGLDDREIIPNVESAPEQLRHHGRQRGDDQRDARSRAL